MSPHDNPLPTGENTRRTKICGILRIRAREYGNAPSQQNKHLKLAQTSSGSPNWVRTLIHRFSIPRIRSFQFAGKVRHRNLLEAVVLGDDSSRLDRHSTYGLNDPSNVPTPMLIWSAILWMESPALRSRTTSSRSKTRRGRPIAFPVSVWCIGRAHPGIDPFMNQFPLELRHGGQDVHEQFGGGIGLVGTIPSVRQVNVLLDRTYARRSPSHFPIRSPRTVLP